MEDIKSKHHLRKFELGEVYHLNKDNDCTYYRRKWWKFWV